MGIQKKLKYPIILVPGLFGHDKIMGIYPLFYNIKETLEKKGAKVFNAPISAVHGDEVRGEQLKKYIEGIRDSMKVEKVNLIGYSQGPLTSRYVAAKYPHLVASVTSVAGVNAGSEIADLVVGALSGKIKGTIAYNVLTLFSKLFGIITCNPGLPQDARKAIEGLTTEKTAKFNKKYPQGLPKVWGGEGKELETNGVYYYSWSGIVKPGIFGQGKNVFDPSHHLMSSLSRLFVKEKNQNDGLVGRYSTHLGKVIASNYNMDHLDAANQTAGLVTATVDPVKLYVQHVDRLKSKGL